MASMITAAATVLVAAVAFPQIDAFLAPTIPLKRDSAVVSMQTHLSSSLFGSSSPPVIAKSAELGGDLVAIGLGPDEDDKNNAGFLTSVGVPTFAVLSDERSDSVRSLLTAGTQPKRLGLEGVLGNSNAFVLENAISPGACDAIRHLCEHELGFGDYRAGKNAHGALQIVVGEETASALGSVIGPSVDPDGIATAQNELLPRPGLRYALRGINRRFRVYRYSADGDQRFAPHIDAGFPPGGSSLDDDHAVQGGARPFLHWDASHQYPTDTEVVSRLTVLIYLNDDFRGGSTKFYEPEADRPEGVGAEASVVASVRPRCGSILVFPQAVSEEQVEMARRIWPLHEGSPVVSGSAKYVIRTDVLFEALPTTTEHAPEEAVFFRHDEDVREVFLERSPMFSTRFLHHVQPLFNPHMGAEHLGPLLYSLVRFTKSRSIVEIGAGYTTVFLLQALKDNDDEMKRVVDLDRAGKLRMLDYPFGTPRVPEWEAKESTLLCIDNCEHQKQTATGAVGVAKTLGLDGYLKFLRGDAYEALDTHFAVPESIDLLWCDFGVGARMAEYASCVWKYIKPGGFLVCHSTLTNQRTREWLEAVRQREGAELTGLPPGEFVELSLLEPHKRFQNSLTILQRRASPAGPYEEPLYSEYA